MSTMLIWEPCCWLLTVERGNHENWYQDHRWCLKHKSWMHERRRLSMGLLNAIDFPSRIFHFPWNLMSSSLKKIASLLRLDSQFSNLYTQDSNLILQIIEDRVSSQYCQLTVPLTDAAYTNQDMLTEIILREQAVKHWLPCKL